MSRLSLANTSFSFVSLTLHLSEAANLSSNSRTFAFADSTSSSNRSNLPLGLLAAHASKCLGKSAMDPVQEQPPPSCSVHFTEQPLQTRYMNVPFSKRRISSSSHGARQFGHDGVARSACRMQSSQNTCSQGVMFGFSGRPKHMEHFSSSDISSGLRGGGQRAIWETARNSVG